MKGLVGVYNLKIMKKKILFIGHDANVAGAQYVLLDFLKSLKQEGFETYLLLAKGGSLLPEFNKVAEVILWEYDDKDTQRNPYSRIIYDKVFKLNKLRKLAFYQEKHKELAELKFDLIFSNTIANGGLLRSLEFLRCPFVVYVHELENSIQKYTLPEDLDYQVQNCIHFLAASKEIKSNLFLNHQIEEDKITVVNPFISVSNILEKLNNADQSGIRKRLNIPNDAIVIGGCGNFEWRKGVDTFLSVANAILSEKKDVHFLWIGIQKNSVEHQNILYDLEKMGIQEHVHVIAPTMENMDYMSCFDIFFLSSREDPHPLVMIEASLNKIPVVCFDKSGGAPEYVEQDERVIIPYGDIVAAKNKLISLIEEQTLREEIGQKMYEKALNYDAAIIAPQILQIIEEINEHESIS